MIIPEKAIQAAANEMQGDARTPLVTANHRTCITTARIALEAALPHLDLPWMNTATELAK